MSAELEEALPPTGAEGAARRARAGGAAPAPAPAPRGRRRSQPGKYSQLVLETIRRLGERGGSSLARIHAEARKVAWFDQQHGRTYLKYSVRALVRNATLLQVRGTGANGSFKLNRGQAPAPAPRAPAPAPKAKKAAAPRRADSRPAKGAPAEKRALPRGAAAKDKGSGKAPKAAGKKVKKAAKPSVPKVPKGRK